MFNFVNIIKNNRNTFYDYATGEKREIIFTYILKIVIACVASLMCLTPSVPFIDATLQVHAILLGFSFNVIFYLLASDKLRISSSEVSIEKRLTLNKLNKLSDELFFNVSYFNIIALSVIIVALLSLALSSVDYEIATSLKEFEILQTYMIQLKKVAVWAYNALFYFLIIESLSSFGRNIGRVSYFFQKKIALKESDIER